MRISLGLRLFLGSLVVAVLGLGSAGILVDRNVERAAFDQTADRLQYEVTMTGQMTASAMFAPLSRDDTSLQGPIKELGDAVHTHLSLVAPDGSVVADSQLEAGSLLPTADGSWTEIADAIANGQGKAIRGEGAQRRMWVAEAVRRDGALLGVARASVPVSVIEAQVAAVRTRLAAGAAIAMFIAVLSAMTLALGILRPIRRLSLAARRLGEGELGVRANIAAGDEIGDLGRALDDMAGNLQRLVARIDERNSDMRRVLDTVDQGLLTVDLAGMISTERSARVDAWFGNPAANSTLWSLFPELDTNGARSFEMGWRQLADDFLPTEVALDQLPQRVTHGAIVFELRYLPIGGGELSRRFLVVISDITAQVTAERVDAMQRDLLRALDRAQRDRAGIVSFLREADVLVTRIAASDAGDAERKRHLHTLKGNCGVFGIHSIARHCHSLETRLLLEERAMSGAERADLRAAWTTMSERVSSLLGEERENAFPVSWPQFVDVLDASLNGRRPSMVARRLAEWTLTPVEVSFARIGDHAFALAKRMGKEVTVTSDGGGLRLNDEVWGGFWSAFVHAIRNAVDHGIEDREHRLLSGKLATGALRMTASLAGDSFAIELRDDGRGVCWSEVADRLRERGAPCATSAELREGLFLEGLSTAHEVNEVSGRGIGMSALRTAVHERGGRIEIDSRVGFGTTLRCLFPASAAHVDPVAVLERALRRQSGDPGERGPRIASL